MYSPKQYCLIFCSIKIYIFPLYVSLSLGGDLFCVFSYFSDTLKPNCTLSFQLYFDSGIFLIKELESTRPKVETLKRIDSTYLNVCFSPTRVLCGMWLKNLTPC